MNPIFLSQQVEKHHQKIFVGLLVLWSVIQWATWFHFGIKESCDSPQYYLSAEELLKGIIPSGREFFYTSYIAVLAVLQYLGAAKHAVVGVHIVCGFCSVILLYNITYFLSQSKVSALLSMAVYVCWFKFQQWNLIIYTDALFVYFIVFSMAFLVFYKGTLKELIAMLLILFTTFIRPPGIGFLVALLGYFFLWKVDIKRLKSPRIIFVLLGFMMGGLLLINQFLSPFITMMIRDVSKGIVIYPDKTLGVVSSNDLWFPEKTDTPLWQFITYLVHNYLFIIKLFILKVSLFLGHVKPYYSWPHNLFIMAYLYPLYFFCLYAFKNVVRTPLKFFVMTFLVFQTLTIGLTSENWDGRFLLPLLPWVFIFSAVGIQSFFQLKVSNS